MSSNITEADQLIIQLLTALNSTVSSYTASKEADKEDATANQLSLTALIISLAALIVTLLQAVLEYVSSNSAQGEKCNTGAIGEFSRFAGSRRWSWGHWRRQYFYREFDLDLFKLGMSLHDVDRSEVDDVFSGLENLYPRSPGNFERMGYSWRYDRSIKNSSKLPKNTIRNGICYLSQRHEAHWVLVSPQSLPMRYRLKWFYYLLFRHHREKITPRATWAQLLTLLNVDPKNMHISRVVGADCIPSTLDVPVQKVQLVDLGIFAFCLGFNKVEISTKDRTISAAGPIGTITTESLPGYGAVVRFQILSPRLQQFMTVHDIPFHDLIYHRNQVLGSFIFPMQISRVTRPMRYSWLRNEFDCRGAAFNTGCPTIADEARQWLEVEDEFQVATSVAWETDVFPLCLAAWRTRQKNEHEGCRRRWPTVLLAAGIACLPGTSMGFPSSAFLRPFLPIFQHMAKSCSSTVGKWFKLDDLEEDSVLDHFLRGDFWRIVGHEDLIYRHGYFSWAFSQFGPVDLERVERILLSQMPIPEPLPGTFQDRRVYRARRRKPQRMSNQGRFSASLLEGRLLPYTVELLTSFDPSTWAEAMHLQGHPTQKSAHLSFEEPLMLKQVPRSPIEASSILWTQTFLFDIAICNVINQYVNSGQKAIEGAKHAMVDCWEDSKADYPLQDLDKLLYQKFFPDKGTQEQAEKMRVLADMIKMRTLCYIAYMMVIPDSTSLYEASLRDPVMLPMI